MKISITLAKPHGQNTYNARLTACIAVQGFVQEQLWAGEPWMGHPQGALREVRAGSPAKQWLTGS